MKERMLGYSYPHMEKCMWMQFRLAVCIHTCTWISSKPTLFNVRIGGRRCRHFRLHSVNTGGGGGGGGGEGGYHHHSKLPLHPHPHLCSSSPSI